MILKVTLFGLILLLIAVIAASYYANKEGFDNLPVPNPVTAPIATPVTAPIATPVTAPVKAAVLPIAQVPQVPKGQQGQVAPRDTSPLASLMPHNMTYTPTITPQSSVTPQRTDVQAQVEISDTGYNAMSLQQKSNLLKTIQQMVKNEVLATRATQPIDSDDDCSSASPSEAQGNEYNHKAKNDMTQYIKKDSIPCAGCTLDY